MRVQFTPAALRDLKSIGDFIALDNRRRARNFVKELRVACGSLATNSLRYPLVTEWQGTRRMPSGNYLVLYRVLNDRVQITRVLHSARDISDILG